MTIAAIVLLLIYLIVAAVECRRLKVAVIGSGISGSSLAYFLSKDITSDKFDINVFEREDRVGGRMRSVQIGERLLEVGAGIGVRPNQYFHNLTVELGLSPVAPSSVDGPFGIFNGNDFAFITGKTKISTVASLLWKYGLSMPIMQRLVYRTVEKFGKVYSMQMDERRAFRSPSSFLKALDLYNFTQANFTTILAGEDATLYGFGRITAKFIDEWISAITRINYNQSARTINALAGLIACTPMTLGSDDIFVVHKGNAGLCSSLISASKAQLEINARVDRIARAGSQWKLAVNGEERPDRYDIVVIAMSMENDPIAIEDVPIVQVEYQTVLSTFVTGSLNGSYFGQQAPLPAMIGTIESEAIPFSSIGSIARLDNNDTRLFKFFSRQSLQPDQLEKIFNKGQSTIESVTKWKAYPKFKAPESFSNFSLAPGLYYVNAIENAASAVEVMAVAAKNVALLIAKDFGQEPAGASVKSSPTIDPQSNPHEL